jgi:hypothetical protein
VGRWFRLFGERAQAMYLTESSAAEDELAMVWVDGVEPLVCRSEVGLIALVHLAPGCSLDEAREALRKRDALVASDGEEPSSSGVRRIGPAAVPLWRLAGRVEILGRLHPEHAETAGSILRVLVGEATKLDRDRVAAIRRTGREDDAASAILTLAAVALLVDDDNPLAEGWFGAASLSLTRAGVPGG